jgi:hypothetical protein
MVRKLKNVGTAARRATKDIFARLDYGRLGPIYCDEGGDEFWAAKRGLCQRLGLKLAKALLPRLQTGGTSLYVGAGGGGNSAPSDGKPGSRETGPGL